MGTLPLGKLEPGFLDHLLGKYTRSDERVLVGSSVGEDATVIDFGATCLVAKTDPITFATDEIGWYVVHINANDIAVTGGVPRWFLVTLLLPEGKTDETSVEGIFLQMSDACAQLNVSLCGGHTEVTYGLDRPIVVGQMLGEVEREKLVTSGGGKPDDVLLLSKGIAVEATAIIAREKEEELSHRYPADFLARCRNMLRDPGISILREARLAVESVPRNAIHAMHDPTEGGVATGVWELAVASGTGVVLDGDALPVLPQTQSLCAEYGLDPLGVIASGSILVAVDSRHSASVLEAWRAEGIDGAVIGRLAKREAGMRLAQAGKMVELPRFRRDEITRLFEEI
jgi:hydrogenase expression/formation protein HypE